MFPWLCPSSFPHKGRFLAKSTNKSACCTSSFATNDQILLFCSSTKYRLLLGIRLIEIGPMKPSFGNTLSSTKGNGGSGDPINFDCHGTRFTLSAALAELVMQAATSRTERKQLNLTVDRSAESR